MVSNCPLDCLYDCSSRHTFDNLQEGLAMEKRSILNGGHYVGLRKKWKNRESLMNSSIQLSATQLWGNFCHCSHPGRREDLLKRDTCVPAFGYQTIETMIPKELESPQKFLPRNRKAEVLVPARRTLFLGKRSHTALTICKTSRKQRQRKSCAVMGGTVVWLGQLGYTFSLPFI